MMTNSLAITLENFQQVIIEESKNQLVLVDFWAQQIPESVELRDKLTAALANHGDTILFATVDCETQGQIAQQFGIQGLPTAVLVKDGQPLDGLTGPQTDESINEFLAKYLPKQQDLLLVQAKDLLAEGNVAEAFPIISQAYQLDNERADIKLVLANVYIQTGKITEAESLLKSIKMIDQDSDYQSLMAKLELAMQAADSPEIQALEQQLLNEPDNVELQQKLAAQYSQVNRNEDALTILFRLVQKNGADIASKDLLLDVLKSLPDGDALASKYRRKLYTLMY
ncbi:tetratricopeptide repeat protein [Cognaticolwellia aestuarii]|jgi:putative thioredoxin|uniref:tetratricopeptide repeat protein n=1 Tax=Cognaticolwellia aestuarii TaxID=329993 RepID=UPI001F224F58|nr:tetratricopeptide repeat protein [Cognaticolwellia aestuarii]|tara:strand:- start:10730 stop:11578 length:849 start_codon:yes stop_codon:yes gene_type:complete